MATKQIKKLSDLQKITTATGDQMIPVVDASGNVNPIKLTDLAQVVAELIFFPKAITDFSYLDNMFFKTTINIHYFSFPSNAINPPLDLSGQAGYILIRKYGTNGTVQIIICSSAKAYIRSNSSSEIGAWSSWTKF